MPWSRWFDQRAVSKHNAHPSGDQTGWVNKLELHCIKLSWVELSYIELCCVVFCVVCCGYVYVYVFMLCLCVCGQYMCIYFQNLSGWRRGASCGCCDSRLLTMFKEWYIRMSLYRKRQHIYTYVYIHIYAFWGKPRGIWYPRRPVAIPPDLPLR